jgi:hypothetical protein
MTHSRMILRSITIPILVALLSVSVFHQMVLALPSAEYHITVDSNADDPTLTACMSIDLKDCSLRGAIIYANAREAGSVIYITIPTGTYNLTLDVPGENLNAGGDLDILGRTVFMQGAGRSLTIINSQVPDRILDNQGGVLTVEHLKITGGKAPSGDSGGGGIINRGHQTMTLIDVQIEGNSVLGNSQYVDNGGGISNGGTLMIRDSTIISNSACNGGGIVSSSAWMTIEGSYIGQNTARNEANCGDGGGIATINGSWEFRLSEVTVEANDAARGAGIFFNSTGGSIRSITDSLITYNDAYSSGGGLSNYGDITLNRVTLSANSAFGAGGGVDNMGTLKLTNVTISANVSFFGGGLANHDSKSVILDHCTIANNIGHTAGMAFFGETLSQNTFHNTILASSPIRETCALYGTISDSGYNLSSDDSCLLSIDNHDLIGVDPLLGVLDDNGGYTPTMGLLTGSPAIDAGDPIMTLNRDQRSYFRPVDGDLIAGAFSDIGAYEYASFILDLFTWLPVIVKTP